MAKRLKADEYFIPCEIAEDDELYANGIFEFNITKMVAYIQENHDKFALEKIAVNDIPSFSSIESSKLDSITIGIPVILAEISPGRYNLIDGHHRMEKARKTGLIKIEAYRLPVDQHIRFLTNKKAYVTYVEYWNDKLKQFNSIGEAR